MSKNVRIGLIWAFVGVMLAVMYVPILILIIYSFTGAKALGVWSGFSLELYADLFTNESVLSACKNSFIIAFASV